MTIKNQRSGLDRRRQIRDNAASNDRFVVASISHDIRTPMQALVAMIDLLDDTPMTPQQIQYIDVFRDSSKYLLSLLNDLLDYSAIESGHIQLKSDAFDLPALVKSISALMEVQATNKKISLRCEIDRNIKPWRMGDSIRLQQIIVNLVSNAIKFTSDGDVVIRLVHLSNEKILLQVSDTGAGIKPEELRIIFQSFQRGSTTTTDRIDGVGLGLAICKQLVEAMDGNICVHSTPGFGSTFTCELKLPAAESAGLLASEQPIPVATKLIKNHLLTTPKILVADDSMINRVVIREFLQDIPCCIEFATNGQEAFEKLTTDFYDLALMDLRMPGMDGLAATGLTRQYEKENQKKKTPIIALTGKTDSEDMGMALQAGCDDFLVKPVCRETLSITLQKFLSTEKNH